MKKTLFLPLVVIMALANGKAEAFPFQGKYLPQRFVGLGRRFPLKQLIADVSTSNEFKKKGVTVATALSRVEITGVDKFDAKWMVTQDITAGGGSIYSADLDANGQMDFIICLGTSACGIAPAQHIVFVMMDINGHPTAYDITGDYQYGTNGIDDLRRISRQKNAVFIQQYLANDLKAHNNYWKTTAWSAHAGGWRPMNKLANEDLPAYVMYKFKENHYAPRPNPKAVVDGEDGMVRLKAKPQPARFSPNTNSKITD